MSELNQRIRKFREEIGQTIEGLALLMQMEPDEYAELEKEWPKSLPVDPELGVISITKKFSYDEFHSVEDFIFETRDIGLSHLVIYESNNAKFLDNVYQKPDSYSYLELEFDSKMRDFENKVRIYKINYEEFDKMN